MSAGKARRIGEALQPRRAGVAAAFADPARTPVFGACQLGDSGRMTRALGEWGRALGMKRGSLGERCLQLSVGDKEIAI